MIRTLAICALFAVILCGGPARAEIGVAKLVEMYESGSPADRAKVEDMIAGINLGITWTSNWAATKKNTKIFCPPGDAKTWSPAYTMRALSARLKDEPNIADMPFGMAVLTTLVLVYPCDK